MGCWSHMPPGSHLHHGPREEALKVARWTQADFPSPTLSGLHTTASSCSCDFAFVNCPPQALCCLWRKEDFSDSRWIRCLLASVWES